MYRIVINVRYNVYIIIVQVLLSSQSLTISPGGKATFLCTSSGQMTVSVLWFINGTQFQDLNLMNVAENFTSIGSGIGVLTFTNLPAEYSMTRIQCQATLSSEEIANSTNTAILLISGIIVLITIELLKL